MHRVRRRFLPVALLLSAFLAPPVHAQGGGIIRGTVRDAQGAPREGAHITAVNTTTGVARNAVSGTDGTYSVGGLAAGTYTVHASLLGFRRLSHPDVQVSEGGETTVDFALTPVTLQTTIVTATLREQELVDVPFSIASPTAADLQQRGVDNIEGVAANVAGFSVQNLGPGQSQVAMRGTSSGQIARDQPGVKEQVGIYLDEVPISLSLFTPDMDLFDVSRVEVLRGPQGTLFGAGSLSGTVRYITNQPELGVHSTFGEFGGGWIDGGNGGGNVKVGTNVPFGDNAAGRLDVYYNRLAGWMDAVQPNGTTNQNVNTGTRTGLRGSVLFKPSDKFDITPRFIFQNVRADGWNRHDAFNILANPFTTTRPAITLGPWQLFTQIGEPYTDNFALGDILAHLQLGPVRLTSITAYDYRDILVVRDAGALTSSITGGSIGLPEDIYTLNAPLNDKTNVHVFTQELRASGEANRLKWVVGGFFAGNKRAYGQSLLVSGFQAASGIPTVGLRAQQDELFYSDLKYDLRQGAVFGEATVSATDRLDLTGGLRWYHYSESRTQVFDGIFGNDGNGDSLVSNPGSTNADGVAPRFIASYKVNDNLRLNGQVSRGFRLGGINDPLNVPLCTAQDLSTFSGHPNWKDETAWDYEAGLKSTFLQGRASFNFSAFWMDVRNLQLTVTAGSCSSRLIFNVPKSVSRGLEAELAMTPTRDFDFAISAAYDNSELRSTFSQPDSLGNPVVIAGIKSGNRLPSVPKFQLSTAATFRRPIRPGMDAFINGTYFHVGSRYTLIDDEQPGYGVVDLTTFGANTIGGPLTQNTFTFNPLLPAYNIVNGRVGLTRGTWEGAFFVNNIGNEQALLGLDRERGKRARVGYLVNQPRTYGVTVTFNY